MPTFQTTIPDDSQEIPFRLRRTPATGHISGVITSTEMIGCYTHFRNNRTMPCEMPEYCESCHDGWSKRFHVYMSAIEAATCEHFILEVTACASDTFRNYQAAAGSIRGCAFRIDRPSGRPNGRMRVQCRMSDPTKAQIPQPPDLIKLLCHIWNVPIVNAPKRHP